MKIHVGDFYESLSRTLFWLRLDKDIGHFAGEIDCYFSTAQWSRKGATPLQYAYIFCLDVPGLKYSIFMFFRTQEFFYIVQQPLMGQVLLIIEALRSHSDTPHIR
jgi:hypothetical protein